MSRLEVSGNQARVGGATSSSSSANASRWRSTSMGNNRGRPQPSHASEPPVPAPLGRGERVSMCGQFAIDAAGNWRPLPLAQQCASAPFFGAVGPDGKPTTSTITQIIAASRTRTPPRSPVKRPSVSGGSLRERQRPAMARSLTPSASYEGLRGSGGLPSEAGALALQRQSLSNRKLGESAGSLQKALSRSLRL